MPYLLRPIMLGAFLNLAACAAALSDTPAENAVTAFQAPSVDGMIAGEIHTVAGSQPDTVVIITGGSGVGERADTAAAIGLFLNETTAVAIYDRRGFGASSGTATVPDTANTGWLVPALGSDLVLIADHLDQLGYDRIGLMGSSMGGWINAHAAARSDVLDFAVNLVGGAASVSVSDTFDRLTDDGLSIAQALERAPHEADDIGYDPANDLAQVSIPMVWVLGECDDSNPSRLDIAVIDRLREAGKDVSYVLVAQADHNFRHVETGAPVLDWVPGVIDFVAMAGR